MAIDSVNWQREMKKFIGAELNDLKNEIAQLRADVNTLNELMRILIADNMLTNLERNFPPNVESKTARKKISVFGMHGTGINIFCDIANSRNLPVDFIVTDDLKNFSAQSAVFIINNLELNDADKNIFNTLYKNCEKILIVVDDVRNRKNFYAEGVFTKFKNSFKNLLSDLKKIPVLYVDLIAANSHAAVLYELSNFPEVEKFFKDTETEEKLWT